MRIANRLGDVSISIGNGANPSAASLILVSSHSSPLLERCECHWDVYWKVRSYDADAIEKGEWSTAPLRVTLCKGLVRA